MLGANLGLLLAAFAWGSMIPLINLLLATWDPYFLAAIRYALAVPVLLLAVWLVERSLRLPAAIERWRIWLLGAVGIGSFAALYTVGIAHANPVTAAIISATAPAVAALVGRFGFGLPIERRMLPAILSAVLGCALATFDPGDASAPFELRGGEPMLLLGGACWAWYSIAAQRWLQGWSQIRITGSTILPGSLLLVLIYAVASAAGAARLPPAAPASTLEVGYFAWMVLVPVAAAVLCWHHGVRTLGVVVASLYLNLIPVIAILISAVLGTRPTVMQIAGGCLVIAGLLQAQLRQLLLARRRPGARHR